MTPSDSELPTFDDEEGPNLSPPGEGFELYRHKDAEKMRTRKAITRSATCPPCLGSTQCPGASCLKRASKSTTRR
jgi:hypothetical protein